MCVRTTTGRGGTGGPLVGEPAHMTLKTINTIAGKHCVRVSTQEENGKRVIGLHGFLSDIESALTQITGYWVERADTGIYLYSYKAKWA